MRYLLTIVAACLTLLLLGCDQRIKSTAVKTQDIVFSQDIGDINVSCSGMSVTAIRSFSHEPGVRSTMQLNMDVLVPSSDPQLHLHKIRIESLVLSDGTDAIAFRESEGVYDDADRHWNRGIDWKEERDSRHERVILIEGLPPGELRYVQRLRGVIHFRKGILSELVEVPIQLGAVAVIENYAIKIVRLEQLSEHHIEMSVSVTSISHPEVVHNFQGPPFVYSFAVLSEDGTKVAGREYRDTLVPGGFVRTVDYHEYAVAGKWIKPKSIRLGLVTAMEPREVAFELGPMPLLGTPRESATPTPPDPAPP